MAVFGYQAHQAAEYDAKLIPVCKGMPFSRGAGPCAGDEVTTAVAVAVNAGVLRVTLHHTIGQLRQAALLPLCGLLRKVNNVCGLHGGLLLLVAYIFSSFNQYHLYKKY